MSAAHASPTLDSPVDIEGLSFLWLEITGKCNLECVHCYADSSPANPLHDKMATEDWVRTIREGAELGCRQVQFIGGEPTLHPRLPEMICEAAAAGYTFIEVFTNAVALSDRLMATFVEHHVHVATSFYSPEAEIHDRVTKRRGSLGKTVATMRRVLDAGLPLRAGVIVMAENRDQAEASTSFLADLGVAAVGVDHLRGVGRGSAAPSQGTSLDELCGACWSGKLCVTSSGAAYPCVMSRGTGVGDAREGLRPILESLTLREFRRTVKAMSDARFTAACGPEGTCNPPCSPGCSPSACSPDRNRFDPCNPDKDCFPSRGGSKCGPTTCAPRPGGSL